MLNNALFEDSNKKAVCFLDALNPEQREAVLHVDGPLLIFAGAGSGKTRVLTHRFAWLVKNHDVKPDEILSVTFTNKAALEMKQRIADLLELEFFSPWISTFHSFCARILRAHAEAIDFTPQFVIYDARDSLSALKRAFSKCGVDLKRVDARMVGSVISKAKNHIRYADYFRNRGNEGGFKKIDDALLADLYDSYQEILHKANAMDFGDLLCNVVNLFTLEPGICDRYQDYFRYIMVDEYQDTNFAQYKIIHMLSKKRKNLAVVGDDDQSIYAFRGASVENILSFRGDFPQAKVVTLEINYRSTSKILQAAENVIQKNRNRHYKKIRTENPPGEDISSFKGRGEQEEAAFVVCEIRALLDAGIEANQIGILYRMNAQSRIFEEYLCDAGIDYEIYGGHKFYERKEIKDILAYVRLICNPRDDEAFVRIVNVPARGLGTTSLSRLIAEGRKSGQSLFETLCRGLNKDENPCEGKKRGIFLSSANKKRFMDFIKTIEELSELKKVCDAVLKGKKSDLRIPENFDAIAFFLSQVASKSGYVDALKKQGTPEALSRVENVYELFNVATTFAKRAVLEGDEIEVSNFLEKTALANDLDDESAVAKGKKSLISLMTLHLAKGLEFDCVFLVGLEEGLLPHVRSMHDPKDMEEERRLCYVGITRAKKKLFLTRADMRQRYGSGLYRSQASRFFEDISPGLLSKSRN